MPNTIVLKAEAPVYREAPVLAGQTVLPGMLLTSAAGGTVRPHDVNNLPAHPVYVATEGSWTGLAVGSRLSRTIDDALTAGEVCRYAILNRGSVLWGLIEIGENLAAGDRVQSSGGGTLIGLAAGKAIGVLLEAVDATLATTRGRVEVL